MFLYAWRRRHFCGYVYEVPPPGTLVASMIDCLHWVIWGAARKLARISECREEKVREKLTFFIIRSVARKCKEEHQ